MSGIIRWVGSQFENVKVILTTSFVAIIFLIDILITSFVVITFYIVKTQDDSSPPPEEGDVGPPAHPRKSLHGTAWLSAPATTCPHLTCHPGQEFYSEINAATLTGAIDVIVVEQEDGGLLSSPFHVRCRSHSPCFFVNFYLSPLLPLFSSLPPLAGLGSWGY